MALKGPSRFGWILPGQLAGSGRPGRFSPLAEDLEFLRAQGVEVIVSLLESPLNLQECQEAGFEVHHFPVEDFAAPAVEQIAEACSVIDQALSQGRKVLAHCNAGIGRTGALLASYLVHCGDPPEEAIRRVREERPLSLETPEQEQVIYQYHRFRWSS